MLAKLIPILFAISGLGAGVGAGIALRPDPTEADMASSTGDKAKATAEAGDTEAPDKDITEYDYVRLNNQFVVPVVQDSKVASLVVMSLSLQVEPGQAEIVYRVEPKLRDVFLRVMFSHANSGGFDGPFTEAVRMRILRRSLMEVAVRELGGVVNDVLITDVVRQDA